MASTSSNGWRYGELQETHVVDAALRFTRREGLAKLTMRKLAAELGVSSMNTYYYVPSKVALLDLVADAVLAHVGEPPAEVKRWEEKIRWIFDTARRVLLDHPGVSDHLLVRAEGGPNTLRLYRLIRSILRDAGFDALSIDHAQRAMSYYLLGAVSQELATATRARERDDALRFTDDEEVFAYGFDLLLAGLDRQRRTAARRAVSSR